MTEKVLRKSDVLRSIPLDGADVEIAVIVQLNMPGQAADSIALQQELTAAAIDTVHSLGGTATVHDVADDEDPDLEAIQSADGLLVLGGGDVDSDVYGHVGPVPNEYGKDRRADEREIAVITRGIESDTVMLAICRGHQLLNVACGGSLVPDLQPHDLHKGGVGQPLFIDEIVSLESGSIVGRLYGTNALTVRNGHHQAVDRVGTGLHVAARAGDGVVEAIERIDNSWIVGVQWHPEEAGASAADGTMLFSEYLGQVRARKRSMVEDSTMNETT